MNTVLSTSIHVTTAVIAAIILILVVSDIVIPSAAIGSIVALMIGVRIATEVVQRRASASLNASHKE